MPEDIVAILHPELLNHLAHAGDHPHHLVHRSKFFYLAHLRHEVVKRELPFFQLFLLAEHFILVELLHRLGGGDQGVAYFAHAGGFAFGLAVAGAMLAVMRRRRPQPRLPTY